MSWLPLAALAGEGLPPAPGEDGGGAMASDHDTPGNWRQGTRRCHGQALGPGHGGPAGKDGGDGELVEQGGAEAEVTGEVGPAGGLGRRGTGEVAVHTLGVNIQMEGRLRGGDALAHIIPFFTPHPGPLP